MERTSSNNNNGIRQNSGFKQTTNVGDFTDKFLITELGMSQDQQQQQNYNNNEEQQIMQYQVPGEELKRPQTDESERGIQDNQIFHVMEAVPPQDYDAPYSKLPANVVLTRVKKNISNSMKFRNKQAQEEWNRIFEMEHADAIISDSFWFVICKVFLKKPDYEAHQEFLLDRIAANYVSFTIVDEIESLSETSIDSKSQTKEKRVIIKIDPKAKERFFRTFYDTIAQAVFYSLFYAFPKSRSSLNDDMKRKLLNIFSKLFTGMKIKSAKFDDWNLDTGTGNILSNNSKKTTTQKQEISLADFQHKKGKAQQKSKRERVHMKYSPLVERYLMTHKYETMNNVREWKMLLTQRTEMQKEIDEKFKKYKAIAQQALDTKNKLSRDYAKTCEDLKQKLLENERAAQKHIETLKQSKKEKLENGGAAGAGDIKNVQNTEAYNLLQELQKEGKLSADTADAYKEKFYQLHEVLVTNMENEQILMKKARALQKELQNEVLKLEKAQQQQKQNEETLKELNNTINDVRREIETIEERRQVLKSEIHQLENEKQDLEGELSMKEKLEKERIMPEIERMNSLINEITMEIGGIDNQISREESQNKEMDEKLTEMDKKKEQLKEDIETLQQNFLKERDEPIRLGKGNENLKKAVEHLKSDLTKLEEDTKQVETSYSQEQNTRKSYDERKENIKKEMDEKQLKIKDLEQNIKRMIEYSQQRRNEILRVTEERVDIESQIKVLESSKKHYQEKMNHLNKRIDDEKKNYKKTDYENNNLLNNIKELETQLSTTKKFEEEKRKECEQFQVYKKNLEEEQQIFVGQLVKKGLEDKNMEAKILKLKQDIIQQEKQVKQFQEEENKWVEEIKFLTTIREKMARTASQAMAQARETKEELKVKELLILDLTKKQQETEFRLNSFIALYEEVKNARNKYVSQIQNSSQDLAEMKERIKILQNEVEILRNESSEKDRALVDIKHQVQKEIYQRDSLRAELNKKDFAYKQKQSVIGQKINEGDKLNLIINSLQKEMNDLIYKYEMACESRNYMGIQLIDRNDELCILYEKANIQENILKNGEQEIRQKEEEIRMINLEFKERQRQLEVVRKQIPEVPELAEMVIDLKKKLDKEREKVEELSELLENPTNHPKWRDLGGQDPEQEALSAKIQVLEERLNNKKESLLEKELVFEEVGNLAEKLRTQALDGRKSTLEIAEKINEYKARTTELSRKMLATVSELSMFQSKALKLQQDKEEKEQILDEAVKRLESGLPPTETAEQEFERLEKNRIRSIQESEERLQRKMLEQQLPPSGVKTTALPRPNSYMPPDIQIPKPYGVFAPFKPSEPGSTMRGLLSEDEGMDDQQLDSLAHSEQTELVAISSITESFNPKRQAMINEQKANFLNLQMFQQPNEVEDSQQQDAIEIEEQQNHDDTIQKETEILEHLENSKSELKEIFRNHTNNEDQLLKANLNQCLEEVCDLINKLIGNNGLVDLKDSLLSVMSNQIVTKITETRIRENRQQSRGGPRTEEEDPDFQKIGLTFNEFYHELFMGILQTIKKTKSTTRFLKEESQEQKSEQDSQIFPILNLNENSEFLQTNRGDLSPIKKIELTSIEDHVKFKLIKLSSLLDQQRSQIENIISNKKLTINEQIQQIFSTLPVKILKILIEQENPSARMSYEQKVQSSFQDELLQVISQQQEVFSFENLVIQIQQIFIKNNGNYELLERTVEEQNQKAEQQNLDEFLLMNQSSQKSILSPVLLDHLKNTQQTYQTLLNRNKFRSESEKRKLIDVIKVLQLQIEQLTTQDKKRLGNQNPFELLLNFNSQDLSPIREKKSISENLNKYDKREKVLKGIFDFYSKQQMLIGKKATFDQIQKELTNMNMGEFMRFCLDFQIPLSKPKIIEIFKKVSGNSKELLSSQFKVEHKKKGLTLPFHTHQKDQGSPVRSQSNTRIKLLSEQEKQKLKAQVKTIKQEREKKKKFEQRQKSGKYGQMRKKLLSQIGEKHDTQYNLGQQNRPNIYQMQSQQKQIRDKPTVITFSQLQVINYKDLNSQSGDDFNPQQFGFDTDPLPIELEIKKHDQNLEKYEIRSQHIMNNIDQQTQNGVMTGLIWNRGQLVSSLQQENNIQNERILPQLSQASQHAQQHGRYQPSQAYSRLQLQQSEERLFQPVQQMWRNPLYDRPPGSEPARLMLQSRISTVKNKIGTTSQSSLGGNAIMQYKNMIPHSQQNLMGYYQKAETMMKGNKQQLRLPPIPTSTKSSHNKTLD